MKVYYKVPLFIAIIQLKSKLTQTIVSIVSVVLGVAIYIYIAGYLIGVNDFANDMTLAESADVRLFMEVHVEKENVIDRVFPECVNFVKHVKPKENSLNLKNAIQIYDELKKDERVRSVSSSVKALIYYHIGSSKVNGTITGINFKDENQLFNLDKKIIEGNFNGLSTTTGSLIMGDKLRKRLNLSLGDKVSISTDEGHYTIGKLTGIIKTGIPNIDNEICYSSEKMVQNLLGVSGYYRTEIKMKLHDIEVASFMASELAKKYSCSYSDLKKDNAALFEGAGLQSLIFDCISLCILMVAGVGIFNILNMMIYEKMKDIAIIKAMGFSNFDIKVIFMSQAIIIGFIGGLGGVLLGFLLSYGTSLLPYKSDIMVSVDHLPMNFSPIFYFAGFFFAILITAFAGYLPSRKASKIDPITILKG